MTKWRVGKSLSGVKQTFAAMLSRDDNVDITAGVRVDSDSVYDLWLKYQNDIANGRVASIDYPGGIEQFERDAMAERERMLLSGGV